MKKIFILLVLFVVGCEGIEGPTGPKGEQGEQGTAGQDGVNGQDGVDGQDGTDAYVNSDIGVCFALTGTMSDEITCYSSLSQIDCLTIGGNMNSYNWVINKTCEELCASTDLNCTITSEEPSTGP